MPVVLACFRSSFFVENMFTQGLIYQTVFNKHGSCNSPNGRFAKAVDLVGNRNRYSDKQAGIVCIACAYSNNLLNSLEGHILQSQALRFLTHQPGSVHQLVLPLIKIPIFPIFLPVLWSLQSLWSWHPAWQYLDYWQLSPFTWSLVFLGSCVICVLTLCRWSRVLLASYWPHFWMLSMFGLSPLPSNCDQQEWLVRTWLGFCWVRGWCCPIIWKIWTGWRGW